MRPIATCLLLMVSLSGCRETPPDRAKAEARAFRAVIERHLSAYQKSIELENALVAETLAWLRGPVATRDRTLLASEARRFTQKWAQVYFMPREIHAALSLQSYETPLVRAAHERILKHLKDRYFTLHDYQRYAQSVSRSDFVDAPPGRMPRPLAEMKSRLEVHPTAGDEISPLVAQMR